VVEKKELQDRKKIVSAAMAAAFIFIVSSLVFMNSTYDQVKAEILASIRDVEKRNIALLRQNLLINRDFVTSISMTLGRLTPELNSPEAIRFIREQNRFTGFGALYLINRDGNMYFGNPLNKGEQEYFKGIMSKNQIHSNIRISGSGKGGYLTINSVIINDSKAIGVLSARFYQDRLNELVTFDIFGQGGYCYLLSKDGAIIARSDNPKVNMDAVALPDLFSSSSGGEDGSKYCATIAGAMQKGLSGEIIYPTKGGNKVVSYIPVGTADLYLLTSVPENVVFAAASGDFFKGILFVMVSFAIFGSFMLFFFRTIRKNSEIIKSTNRELSLIYESMPGGIVRYVREDQKWRIKSANEGFYRLIGCSKEEFERNYGGNIFKILSEPMPREAREEFWSKIDNEEPFETELKLNSGSGDPKWVCMNIDYIRNEDETREVVAIFSDITGIKAADRELYVNKEQFDIVKRLTNVIFFEWDTETGTISHSSNFLDFFDPLDSYENFPYSLKGYGAFSQEDAEGLITLFEEFREGLTESDAEVKAVNRHGDSRWYKVSMSAIFDGSGRPLKVVGILSDIDEQKRKLQTAEESAMKDPLTQLYNKVSTKALIEEYISANQNQGAFMMLDIDNFKRVNDTLGHLYGDAVLSELAHTLKSLFSDTDIIGRVGGDEFVVFMTNINELAVIRTKAERILSAFKRPFRTENAEQGISCSIGVSIYPGHGSTYDELMQKADSSLYFSKSSGKDQCTLYADDVQSCGLFALGEARGTTEIAVPHGFVQKNFRENVAEYILKLFYQYDDVDTAVPILLEFVGNSFKMGRMDVSVFSEDDTYYEILYEWCDEGVSPLKKEGKKFFADEWSSIKAQLDENDILLCQDADIGIPDYLENDHMRVRGVKSTMLCYIIEKGKRRAVLAFEYLKEKHIFTKEEKETIRTISDTISLFVLRARERALYNEKVSQMKNWEIVLDETDDVVYVSDAENYDLLYLNKAGRELPWIAGRDFRCRKCHEFFFGTDKPCSFCTMDLLSKDKYYIWERTDQNSGNHYMLKDKLIDWNGRLARIEWAINLTEKEQQQKILSSRLKIEKALLEGIGEMAYATDLEESMNVILRRVAELYKADRSYMMRINDDGRTISMTNEWLAEGVAPAIGNLQHFPLYRSPLWQKAFTKQETVFLKDISEFRETYPEEYERLAVQGIEEMYAIPITIKGKFWGFLGVDTPRRYKGDMYVLESVAYFVADEISKRRLIESSEGKGE
jgi:diguanylate cyclase (GGDEF)-like protein/PAS domain S-box-containing protein